MTLSTTLDDLQVVPNARWARANFVGTLLRVVESNAPARILEVGGGRNPLLRDYLDSDLQGVDYVVNDVSQGELDRLTGRFSQTCFDVQDHRRIPAELKNTCDLVFSKMVFEHIRDPEGAWRTVHALLRPGGVSLMYMPTLYCLPFLVNRVLPSATSAALLRRVHPNRNDDQVPKFPAYYSWCRASEDYLWGRLRDIGYRSVEVAPFWGHSYFDKIPLLRTANARFDNAARRRDWRAVASFAYVMATR